MGSPQLHLTSEGPGPEAFEDLQVEFRRRQRRFLHILAYAYRPDELVLAMTRKYLWGRQVADADLGKGWGRLYTPPSGDWKKRILQPVKDAKKARYNDHKITLWTDDPVARDDFFWLAAEEDVNVVSARLAIETMEKQGVFDDIDDPADPWPSPAFPPDLRIKLPTFDQRTSAKAIARAIFDFGVVQLDDRDDRKGKDIKAVMTDRSAHVVPEPADVAALAITVQPKPPTDVLNPLLDELKTRVQEFLDNLHIEVKREDKDEERRRSLIADFLGAFPGVDPSLLADQVGLDFATTLLTLRRYCPTTASLVRLVDFFAFLAELGQQPLAVALPALSDVIALRAEPSWSQVHSAWIVTPSDSKFVRPAPAPPESLADGDDTLYRALVCQLGKADPEALRFFRMDPAPYVPSGWSWPGKDQDFAYWWASILRRHCAEHLMTLKDTADFHAADLLRFSYLFHLFGAAPDPRVPRYVADCVKAALLHFKYWFDEPPATGNDGGEMSFWSENHQIEFHSSQFLAGRLFPDDVFPRSGVDATGRPVTGREHERRGRDRLERWLDRRLAFGFSEWNSPGYYEEDFPPVLNVADFGGDGPIAEKAAMVADLLVFDLARNTCRGSFGVTAGRAYFEHKAYGWEQSVGETIEILFGTRGDHMRSEKTAIALCTSPKYRVPDALLAIGRDRELLDRTRPMAFKTRVSINVDEAREHGVGFESEADAAFWWGNGAYFDPATMELTRAVAGRYKNLDSTNPPGLLFKFDLIGGFLQTLLLDAAQTAAGGALAAGSSLLIAAPFPINLAAGATYITSISTMIEGLMSLIEDIGSMIRNAAAQAKAWLLGEDPPKPEIPRAALIRAWEAMLTQFNAGSILSRANLYTYSAGDAMLSSAQNHRAREISFQKQPWMASLGCDACVWTNAPMDPGGAVGTVGWEVFKHLATVQASRAFGDVAGALGVGLEEIRDQGLRDWGGSICLPKVAQHRSAAIIAYEFPSQRSDFSATYTHAWFPCEFFDEVKPAPVNEDLLPERDGGGTWVFARRDDGYVALCSARRVKWIRDARFDGDPDPMSPDGTMEKRFTSTELRAEDGSNIWICAVGTRAQFGSFGEFAAKIGEAYLNFSGVGSIEQLECTFDMPDADGTGEPGFRWELFFDDDEAHLNGAVRKLDRYPRFEGRYISGKSPGRVEWRETSYRIEHPITGLWVSHDIARALREPGPPQERKTQRPRGSIIAARPAVALRPGRAAPPAAAKPIPTNRSRRFRLEPGP